MRSPFLHALARTSTLVCALLAAASYDASAQTMTLDTSAGTINGIGSGGSFNGTPFVTQIGGLAGFSGTLLDGQYVYLTSTGVPEPSSFLVILAGLAGVLCLRWGPPARRPPRQD